jgi:hypothetical protein
VRSEKNIDDDDDDDDETSMIGVRSHLQAGDISEAPPYFAVQASTAFCSASAGPAALSRHLSPSNTATMSTPNTATNTANAAKRARKREPTQTPPEWSELFRQQRPRDGPRPSALASRWGSLPTARADQPRARRAGERPLRRVGGFSNCPRATSTG